MNAKDIEAVVSAKYKRYLPLYKRFTEGPLNPYQREMLTVYGELFFENLHLVVGSEQPKTANEILEGLSIKDVLTTCQCSVMTKKWPLALSTHLYKPISKKVEKAIFTVLGRAITSPLASFVFQTPILPVGNWEGKMVTLFLAALALILKGDLSYEP